jgi:hypothetical protein
MPSPVPSGSRCRAGYDTVVVLETSGERAATALDVLWGARRCCACTFAIGPGTRKISKTLLQVVPPDEDKEHGKACFPRESLPHRKNCLSHLGSWAFSFLAPMAEGGSVRKLEHPMASIDYGPCWAAADANHAVRVQAAQVARERALRVAEAVALASTGKPYPPRATINTIEATYQTTVAASLLQRRNDYADIRSAMYQFRSDLGVFGTLAAAQLVISGLPAAVSLYASASQ